MVKPCFGKYGNTECGVFGCDRYRECINLYSEWFNEERDRISLTEFIRRYKNDKGKKK